jgi:hypothetical protein
MKMLRRGLRLTIFVATVSLSFGQQTTQEWRPNVHGVMIDFQVMLSETKQFVPGLKSSNVRVFEDDVQQKIERFNESSSARYKLTYSPIPAEDGNQRKIRVELVDDHRRPLLMQDERHRLLKYEITIGNLTGSQSQVPIASVSLRSNSSTSRNDWRPSVREDNASATWDDTLAFLANTLQYEGGKHYSIVSSDRCSLSVRDPEGATAVVDLKKVDPLSVRVSETLVLFSGTNNAPYALDCHSENGACSSEATKLTGSLEVEMKDADTAKRVARAIMHAALLCGGTKAVSPF